VKYNVKVTIEVYNVEAEDEDYAIDSVVRHLERHIAGDDDTHITDMDAYEAIE